MSFAASFHGREGRLFKRGATGNDGLLWLILRLGSRDEHIVGCTHTLEHILIRKIQSVILNTGTVDGYTTHDVLMISISMFDSDTFNKDPIVKALINAFFSIDTISEKEFLEARKQITQELLLSGMNMKKTVTNASVRCLWGSGSLGKPIDDTDTNLSYSDFKTFLECTMSAKFAVMAANPYLTKMARHFSVDSDELHLEMCTDTPSVYDPIHINRRRQDLGPMFIKAWGVGIPAISSDEIMIAGIVSGIWNQRLQALKKHGSYITACFPRIHRGEHSINVIYSGEMSSINHMDELVKEIRGKDISEDEMGFMKSFFTGVKHRAESDELKAMFLTDLFGQDTSVPFDRIISNVHDWCNTINFQKSGSVLWTS